MEKKFLGIIFKCCNVYGRIYENKDLTRYEGRCPKCGKFVVVMKGDNGTKQRFFTAQ